jgi:hypothetical protein
MPFFIKQVPRTVWDVYLVEAASATAVEGLDHDEGKKELLGAYSELDEGDCLICGPFTSRAYALQSPKAWVG